jgi:hypothetical protein
MVLIKEIGLFCLWGDLAHAENFITKNDGFVDLLCIQKGTVKYWLDGKIGP